MAKNSKFKTVKSLSFFLVLVIGLVVGLVVIQTKTGLDSRATYTPKCKIMKIWFEPGDSPITINCNSNGSISNFPVSKVEYQGGCQNYRLIQDYPDFPGRSGSKALTNTITPKTEQAYAALLTEFFCPSGFKVRTRVTDSRVTSSSGLEMIKSITVDAKFASQCYNKGFLCNP